jgi:isopentenyl-diphosphate Delta-isomerase
MAEMVILVDEKDNQLGLEEKMKAHEEARLHRAFSIFAFNGKGETLLQRRALSKYHSGGLWTNTCCSHPRQGESVLDAAHRRLREELGFDCEMEEIASFIYEAKLDHGLTEHELDHVVIGKYKGEKIALNPEEVDSVRWITIENLKKEMSANPELFTEWFKIAFKKFSKLESVKF